MRWSRRPPTVTNDTTNGDLQKSVDLTADTILLKIAGVAVLGNRLGSWIPK